VLLHSARGPPRLPQRRQSRVCLRRYVPLYASQLLAAAGSEGSCQPDWTPAAAAELLAQFWADAPALLPLLGAKPHWMQLAERELHFRGECGGEGGLPLMCHPLAAQMTFATPEALTTRHPVWGWRRYLGRAAAANNSLAVPYLGHVHRMSMQTRAALLASASVLDDKRLLAAAAFAPAHNAELRARLAKACAERPEECLVSDAQDFMGVVAAHARAWFCVQPHGDTPTHVALADCLATGLALPCVFDEYLFDMLPFADVLPYRAFIAYVPPEDAWHRRGSFLDHLAAYGVPERAAMLRAMQGVSQALQYAVRAAPRAAARVRSPGAGVSLSRAWPVRYWIHTLYPKLYPRAGAAQPPAGQAGPAGGGACTGRRADDVAQGRAAARLRRRPAGLPREERRSERGVHLATPFGGTVVAVELKAGHTVFCRNQTCGMCMNL
jgi:hypothetical protein